MPRHTPETPEDVLAALVALGWGAEWLHRVIERRLAAATVDDALASPPDTPGVRRGHPLHDPLGWATVRDDALRTQAKLVQYQRWLRVWAKRGRYDGGIELVQTDDSTP
jgi:hypothetical protein